MPWKTKTQFALALIVIIGSVTGSQFAGARIEKASRNVTAKLATHKATAFVTTSHKVVRYTAPSPPPQIRNPNLTAIAGDKLPKPRTHKKTTTQAPPTTTTTPAPAATTTTPAPPPPPVTTTTVAIVPPPKTTTTTATVPAPTPPPVAAGAGSPPPSPYPSTTTNPYPTTTTTTHTTTTTTTHTTTTTPTPPPTTTTTPAPAPAQAPPSASGFWAPSSFLNTPLPSFTPDPNSANWLAQLQGSETYGLWVDSTAWTPPLYHANASTPTVTVAIPTFHTSITIPYLSSYRPDQSGDSQIAVIDDSTGCEYEFEAFSPSNMSANSEATYNIQTGSGMHANDAGVTGGNISMLGGLVTPQDIASGSINHALRFASPINSSSFVFPGSDSDGSTPGGIPEGQLMRLDPTLDLTQFGLSPYQMMIAKALQKYGAYNGDSSGSFKINSENTIDGSAYTSAPQGLPWSVMSHIQFGSTTFAPGSTTTNSNSFAGCNQQH